MPTEIMLKATRRALVLAALFLISCSRNWKSVEIPAGKTPKDRESLLHGAEEAYGRPRDSGTGGSKKDWVSWKEYVGKHGRIRVNDESYETEEGWATTQWIEIFPGGLYLDDIVRGEYLNNVSRKKGRWKLSIYPPQSPWCLTLELDGNAVVKINDIQR